MAKGGRIQKSAVLVPRSTCTLLLVLLLTLSIILLVLLALGIVSVPVSRSPNGLPARAGTESIDNNNYLSLKTTANTGRSDGLDFDTTHSVEILSWAPRAFIYHNFLTKDECEYLINIARPHMAKSAVVDTTTGQSKDSRVRTSFGAFLRRGQDEIVSTIEKRIADFTFIPIEHGEGIQILHYEVGQKYDAHYDYFFDSFNIKNGGQRIATVLMYLSDVDKGGETVFPSFKVNSSSVPWWDELSECAKGGLSVRPRMGDAVLFWSMRPDASLDPSSLHGSCPVIHGEKWSATKWLHVDEYKV